MTSAYIPSTVSATALRNLGDKRIKMVGIDDDPIVLDAIKDGFLTGTMAQNPYGQAYIGAQVLSYLKQGCTRKADAPTYVDSVTLLISEKNLTTYKDDVKTLTQQISKDFASKYLDCPAGVVAAAPAAEAAKPAAMDMSKVKVAIVPGGPHPYFLPMEGGLADSVKAFGLGQGAFKSPAGVESGCAEPVDQQHGGAGVQCVRHLPRRCECDECDGGRVGSQGHPGDCDRGLLE